MAPKYLIAALITDWVCFACGLTFLRRQANSVESLDRQACLFLSCEFSTVQYITTYHVLFASTFVI